MFDFTEFTFNFPEWTAQCEDCGDDLTLAKARTSGLCDDCEFDLLTPPAWPELFFAALRQWRPTAT